jgi:hypothetical protein
MTNFRLIKSGLDLDGIRRELAASDLWVDMDARPKRPSTHANTDRIQLRTNVRIPGKLYFDIHETVDLPAWTILAETRRFVVDFVRETGGEVGHVRVTNLDASAEIPAHVDIGEYCAIRDRYHLVINSECGTRFKAGEETVTMRENELWWFDNKKMHSVANLGSVPRTHLVFDILPPVAGGRGGFAIDSVKSQGSR